MGTSGEGSCQTEEQGLLRNAHPDSFERHRKVRKAAAKQLQKLKLGHGRTLERMFRPNLYRLSSVRQYRAQNLLSKCGGVLTSTGDNVVQWEKYFE